MAYEVREKESPLHKITEAAGPESNNINVDEVGLPYYRLVPIQLNDVDALVMPHILINNSDWVILLFSIFDPHDKLARQVINDNTEKELGVKADLLYNILCGRFDIHIQNRIKTVSQKSNFSLGWAKKNLSAVAVYMVLVNHVKQDISCLDNLCCLLPNTPKNFLLCTNEEAKLQGAYLHYDGNDEN